MTDRNPALIPVDANFFNHFNYDLWADPDTLVRFPTVESALSALESVANPQAAFALFWKLFGSPDPDGAMSGGNGQRADRQQFLDRMASLMEALKPYTEPDQDISEDQAWAFMHVAAAYALQLERFDMARTDEYWRAIEEAARIASFPGITYVDPTYEAIDSVSVKLITVFVLSKLFQKHETDSEYLRCIETLYKASLACLGISARLLLYSVAESKRELWTKEEVVLPDDVKFPAVFAADIGDELLDWLIPAQQAVDVFESLIESSSSSADWEDVAYYCAFIQGIYAEATAVESVASVTRNPSVRTRSSQFVETAWEFWILAQGLALQKMSPNALADAMRSGFQKESERRLKLYFLEECWDRLPALARQSLIDADRALADEHTNPKNVAHHLREALQVILAERVWRPYTEYLEQKGEAYRLDALRLSNPREEFDLGKWRHVIGWPSFMAFARSEFGRDGLFFIQKELIEPLIAINWAADRRHEQFQPLSREKARDAFFRVVGVGSPGVIQRLMDLGEAPS